MFVFDEATGEYIRNHGGTVVIETKYVASCGDGLLTGRGLLGSLVPRARLGGPADGDGPYARSWGQGVIIYYEPGLRPKAGQPAVRLALNGLASLRWLELEGAALAPVFGE